MDKRQVAAKYDNVKERAIGEVTNDVRLTTVVATFVVDGTMVEARLADSVTVTTEVATVVDVTVGTTVDVTTCERVTVLDTTSDVVTVGTYVDVAITTLVDDAT